MKAVVCKTFRDKNTGAVYAPGEVLTIERERFNEITGTLGSAYIVEVVDPAASAEGNAPEAGAETAAPAEGGKSGRGRVKKSDGQ